MAKREKDPEAQRKSLVILCWILLGFLAASFLINVVTIISLNSLKDSVNDMRDPVNLYFVDQLDELENDLDLLETATENGKSPYKGDIKRLRKDIERTRGLWNKASRTGGTRWLLVFNRAHKAQEKVEAAWAELRTRAGY